MIIKLAPTCGVFFYFLATKITDNKTGPAYWEQRKDLDEIFSHKIEAQITYPIIAQYYIKNVYEVTRDEECGR